MEEHSVTVRGLKVGTRKKNSTGPAAGVVKVCVPSQASWEPIR
ncbi:hypothetical protein [Tessaracoccus flavescens]|nr:hypothetical protein [Tessaracoccus flavescens]